MALEQPLTTQTGIKKLFGSHLDKMTSLKTRPWLQSTVQNGDNDVRILGLTWCKIVISVPKKYTFFWSDPLLLKIPALYPVESCHFPTGYKWQHDNRESK